MWLDLNCLNSLNSDEIEISPYFTIPYSNVQVMRIKKVIT